MPNIYRRRFLKSLVAIIGLPRHALSARASGATYVALREVVSIPASKVTRPWTPVPFDAFLEDPAEKVIDKMLKGILVRAGSRIQAFCIYCPHETCLVEFKCDASAVKLDSSREIDHPMFVCPCHFSVFDPLKEGAPISGPAWRGLYRFQVEEGRESVRVTGVEEKVLTLYN